MTWDLNRSPSAVWRGGHAESPGGKAVPRSEQRGRWVDRVMTVSVEKWSGLMRTCDHLSCPRSHPMWTRGVRGEMLRSASPCEQGLLPKDSVSGLAAQRGPVMRLLGQAPGGLAAPLLSRPRGPMAMLLLGRQLKGKKAAPGSSLAHFKGPPVASHSTPGMWLPRLPRSHTGPLLQVLRSRPPPGACPLPPAAPCSLQLSSH